MLPHETPLEYFRRLMAQPAPSGDFLDEEIERERESYRMWETGLAEQEEMNHFRWPHHPTASCGIRCPRNRKSGEN